nr:unnamed protein product [Callosobruchus analis]
MLHGAVLALTAKLGCILEPVHGRHKGSSVSSGQQPPSSASSTSAAQHLQSPSSVSPPVSMAVTSSSAAPGGSPPAGAAAAASQRCCDTGRPLFTDPLTGQTVCSCQYELLGYQRLAGAAGVPTLPALSMYSAPYPEGMAAYFPALGADQPPFYTSAVSGFSSLL